MILQNSTHSLTVSIALQGISLIPSVHVYVHFIFISIYTDLNASRCSQKAEGKQTSKQINQSINSSFNKNTSDTDAKGFTRNKVTNIKQTCIVTNGHQDYNRRMEIGR